MSAPPIGMMSVTPRISATTVSAQNIQGCAPPFWTIITISTTMATAKAMLRGAARAG